MKRFCYRCGALEAEHGPLIQGLCQRCFAGENRLLQAPAQLEVVICGRCGSHLLGKRWYQSGEGDAAVNAARATVLSTIRVASLSPAGLRFIRPSEAPEVELSIEPKLRGGVIEVRARGKVHELQAEPQVEEARIRFELKRRTCDVCSLKSGRKHEAILQVRGEFKRLEIMEVLERIAAEAGKRDQTAFISNVEELDEGLDFYVNPVGLARQMAAMLKSKFGAKVKESRKLVGQTKDGRKKYKFTISARIPS